MSRLIPLDGHSAIVFGSMHKNSLESVTGIVLGVIKENDSRTVISGVIYTFNRGLDVIDNFVLKYSGTGYPKPDEAYAIVF